MLTATPWPRRRRPANPVEPRRPRVARVCDAANREQLFVAGYAASYSNATRRRLRGRDRASPRYDPYRHNCDRRGVWLNSAGASRRSARNAARNAATPAQYTTGERLASPAVRSTALDASNVNTAMACAASRRRRCATRRCLPQRLHESRPVDNGTRRRPGHSAFRSRASFRRGRAEHDQP